MPLRLCLSTVYLLCKTVAVVDALAKLEGRSNGKLLLVDDGSCAGAVFIFFGVGGPIPLEVVSKLLLPAVAACVVVFCSLSCVASYLDPIHPVGPIDDDDPSSSSPKTNAFHAASGSSLGLGLDRGMVVLGFGSVVALVPGLEVCSTWAGVAASL